jgi:hypothetical protein
VHPRVAAKLVHCWAQTDTHPALPGDEINRVVASIAEAELKKRRKG